MMVIPEYTITATLADGAKISLRVQQPDLEGVVRTLVASKAQQTTITPWARDVQRTTFVPSPTVINGTIRYVRGY